METCCYRAVDGIDLDIDIFTPEGPASSAIVYFHGGSWVRGSREAMHRHCQHLAGHGMVAATASYRLLEKGCGEVQHCIADARAAVAWMRSQAGRLGFPADRLAAGGGSAGGHLAACCATIEAACWPASRPDALVLHNPVVDNGPGEFGYKRIGDDYHQVSPMHRVAKGFPPTCFLLGTEDEGLPISVGIEFQRRIQAVGSRCDLHLFGGMSHGFSGPQRERWHECQAATVAFLRGLGFITG